MYGTCRFSAKVVTSTAQLVIRDGGHNLPREDPEAVIEAIRDIVSQQ
jgi:pimeloyl-ACP methyl ester carboxylesterase